MLYFTDQQAQDVPPEVGSSPPSWLTVFADRWPFLAFVLVIVLCNVAGSAFNIAYNMILIEPYLNDAQKTGFKLTMLGYNLVAYSYCFVAVGLLLRPLARCRRQIRTGQRLTPEEMQKNRCGVVNLPYWIVWLELIGWLPGSVLFPLGICLLADWQTGYRIWGQFLVSFGVSALLTTTQTYFCLEAFLIRFFYPDFFRDTRPADVPGAKMLSFPTRIKLFWLTVAFVPLLALLAVTLNFAQEPRPSVDTLEQLAIWLTLVATVSTGWIAWMVGTSLQRWIMAHATATEQISKGNFEVRIPEQRPDEWGKLTDSFNDMADALGKARHMRESFGQMVHPEVRDEVLERYPGLGGEVAEVTVLFADIRGFTRRSAGEEPGRAVDLLNRFLSLAVAAIEEEGGWVNKFLGDGLMALFGAPRPRGNHADLALRASRELMKRLELLNRDLTLNNQAPLVIGIGIHTGPAVVGCIGAVLGDGEGRPLMRKEFTAIGETVNLSQRLEQLTKTCGGPILISEQTRRQFRESFLLEDLGQHDIPGHGGTLQVFRFTG